MGCSSSKGGAPAGDTLRVDTGGRPANANKAQLHFKVVMMGDKATGKSSLVMRFTKGDFTGQLTSTIGAAFASKDLSVEDGALVRLQIWDTAGEEMYRAMTRSFFRNAAAGVIVYDITNPSSFANTRQWLRDFMEACPDAIAVLVGNKVDAAEDGLRRVPKSEASAFADSQELPFFEVSAKTGDRVNDVFTFLAQTLVARQRGGGGAGGRAGGY